MYQAPSSPLSIGGVLDSGFKLFRECFTQVFLLAVATSLATSPFGYLAPYIVRGGLAPRVIGGLIGGGVVIMIITTILTSAVVVRIDAFARGAPVSFADALRIGARRAPAAFGAGVLTALAVAAIPCVVVIAGLSAGVSITVLIGFAVFLFLIPGSIIAIWLIFGPYAAIADRLGPITSVRYSRAITRGYWWRTTALITIIMIILMVVYTALVLVAGVAMVANPEGIATGQSPWYMQFIVGPVLSGVAVPLSYALFMAIYYDLKLRHEGGDLAARIAGTA